MPASMTRCAYWNNLKGFGVVHVMIFHACLLLDRRTADKAELRVRRGQNLPFNRLAYGDMGKILFAVIFAILLRIRLHLFSVGTRITIGIRARQGAIRSRPGARSGSNMLPFFGAFAGAPDDLARAADTLQAVSATAVLVVLRCRFRFAAIGTAFRGYGCGMLRHVGRSFQRSGQTGGRLQRRSGHLFVGLHYTTSEA